jgi:hypothetical protein
MMPQRKGWGNLPIVVVVGAVGTLADGFLQSKGGPASGLEWPFLTVVALTVAGAICFGVGNLLVLAVAALGAWGLTIPAFSLGFFLGILGLVSVFALGVSAGVVVVGAFRRFLSPLWRCLLSALLGLAAGVGVVVFLLARWEAALHENDMAGLMMGSIFSQAFALWPASIFVVAWLGWWARKRQGVTAEVPE